MIKSAIKALGYMAIGAAALVAFSMAVGTIMIGIQHIYLYFEFDEKTSMLFAWSTLIFILIWVFITRIIYED